jgi:uncharacterized protein
VLEFARMKRLSQALGGHYWTLLPFLTRQRQSHARSLEPLRAEPWSLEVLDAELGPVRLTGRLYAPIGAERALLAIHGLGGSSESLYLRATVLDAYAAGVACLCLNLRGADGLGEDFYHAALTSDLHAALASAALESYRSLHVLGFSLGGHLALRLASEPHDARLRSVAAICSPLDLQRSQLALDAAPRAVYRHYILGRLKASYLAVARRRPVPSPVDRVLRVRSIRRWDELTVVPRFGFDSADDYYRRASAAHQLHALGVPALLVQAAHDPMVLAATVRPALADPPPLLQVHWLERGGHVGFPADIDLGQPAPVGLATQVRSWLTTAAESVSPGARQRGAAGIL